jgi:hypothetical protein
VTKWRGSLVAERPSISGQGDRTVHARTPAGNEVVRYDRSGKWYVESDNLPREHLTINEAVQMAMAPGTRIFFDLPGGSTFDRKVRMRLRVDEWARERVG